MSKPFGPSEVRGKQEVPVIAKPTVRVNQNIRALQVRVIDEKGSQLGVMPVRTAQDAADARGLDLVEVAPQSDPPVCKIMDFGKFKYEQAKKAHESKKHQKVIQVKEVKMRPGTDDHDYNFKMRNARKFLGQGNKVKFTVVFRGRELAHTDLGEVLLDKIREDIQEDGTVEQTAKREGRTMMMIVAPKA